MEAEDIGEESAEVAHITTNNKKRHEQANDARWVKRAKYRKNDTTGLNGKEQRHTRNRKRKKEQRKKTATTLVRKTGMTLETKVSKEKTS